MSAAIIPALIAKRSTWTRTYLLDFVLFAEWSKGQTIASAAVVQTSPPDGALTVTAGAPAGSQIPVTISGGTPGQVYLLTCPVTWSGGGTVDGQVNVRVV